jgi:hypothetical protein
LSTTAYDHILHRVVSAVFTLFFYIGRLYHLAGKGIPIRTHRVAATTISAIA